MNAVRKEMKKIPIRKLQPAEQTMLTSEQFKIRRVEDILQGNDLTHDLHRHDFYFMLVLAKGIGIHEIDFVSYEMKDNTVFFLRPGQVHRLQLKTGSRGYLVEFSSEFYHPNDKLSAQWFRKATHKNFCDLEIKRFKKLCSILDSMYAEYSEMEDGYHEVIRSGLAILLIEIGRQSLNPQSKTVIANSYTQERFEEFLELLEKHVADRKQVSGYADLMNLSHYQLNEITKSSVGKTASELINGHIVLEAKRHLLATANQVKDIADQLGYEDPSYFIRFFKKQTGYSPEAFRNNFLRH
jgi:AraC-like DNA-binding protein